MAMNAREILNKLEQIDRPATRVVESLHRDAVYRSKTGDVVIAYSWTSRNRTLRFVIELEFAEGVSRKDVDINQLHQAVLHAWSVGELVYWERNIEQLESYEDYFNAPPKKKAITEAQKRIPFGDKPQPYEEYVRKLRSELQLHLRARGYDGRMCEIRVYQQGLGSAMTVKEFVLYTLLVDLGVALYLSLRLRWRGSEWTAGGLPVAPVRAVPPRSRVGFFVVTWSRTSDIDVAMLKAANGKGLSREVAEQIGRCNAFKYLDQEAFDSLKPRLSEVPLDAPLEPDYYYVGVVGDSQTDLAGIKARFTMEHRDKLKALAEGAEAPTFWFKQARVGEVAAREFATRA